MGASNIKTTSIWRVYVDQMVQGTRAVSEKRVLNQIKTFGPNASDERIQKLVTTEKKTLEWAIPAAIISLSASLILLALTLVLQSELTFTLMIGFSVVGTVVLAKAEKAKEIVELGQSLRESGLSDNLKAMVKTSKPVSVFVEHLVSKRQLYYFDYLLAEEIYKAHYAETLKKPIYETR